MCSTHHNPYISSKSIIPIIVGTKKLNNSNLLEFYTLTGLTRCLLSSTKISKIWIYSVIYPVCLTK